MKWLLVLILIISIIYTAAFASIFSIENHRSYSMKWVKKIGNYKNKESSRVVYSGLMVPLGPGVRGFIGDYVPEHGMVRQMFSPLLQIWVFFYSVHYSAYYIDDTSALMEIDEKDQLFEKEIENP